MHQCGKIIMLTHHVLIYQRCEMEFDIGIHLILVCFVYAKHWQWITPMLCGNTAHGKRKNPDKRLLFMALNLTIFKKHGVKHIISYCTGSERLGKNYGWHWMIKTYLRKRGRTDVWRIQTRGGRVGLPGQCGVAPIFVIELMVLWCRAKCNM